jgi:type I restriction enzyme, S subunit
MIDWLNAYSAYKDSGVPWLGDVPEHWQVSPLGRIGQFFKGNGGNKSDEALSGVPCVRYGDLYTQHEFFIRRSRSFVTTERSAQYTPIRKGDILFAASGETIDDIGRSAENLIEGDARCGGDVIVFRANCEVVPEFLGYACDSPASKWQKARMGRGFTVVHIYAGELKYLTVAIPPLPEQTAVVRFLNYADRRIRRYVRTKKKLIKLLEEQKQSIIQRAVTQGLRTNARWRASGVEWLGDVPEHWEVRRIASFSPKITNGWVGPTRDILRESGVPYIQSLHIKRGAIRFVRKYFIGAEWLAARPKIRLQRGDVVVVQTGDIGQVACVPEEFDGAGCHALIIIRTDERVIEGRFLDLVLRSPYGYESLKSMQTGALHPHLNCTWVREIFIPVPPLSEQREILQYIADATKSLDEPLIRSEREIALIREYRSRLIADVVTGKVDVCTAAASLPQEAPEAEPLDETGDVPQDEFAADDEDLEAADAA